MKECEICWTEKETFFDLECCPHDICKDCIEQIRNPSCPFCRAFIPILSIGRRNSISYEPPPDLHENYYLWSSMDDLYLYSRWYRRRRRREERLRQREEHNESNRQRSRRHNLRREVRQEVREYLQQQRIPNRFLNQNLSTISSNSSHENLSHENSSHENSSDENSSSQNTNTQSTSNQNTGSVNEQLSLILHDESNFPHLNTNSSNGRDV